MSRLQKYYKETVVPQLQEKFSYANVMEVPKVTKITLNMGVGEAVGDKKVMVRAVGDMTASIDGMEMVDGNLRMLNPTLKGSDKKNGKYVVRAEYADQDIQNPKIVKLHAIKADLSTANGGWTRMKAARGIFNSLSERLVMQDRITLATSAGITGELEHATLDMESQTLRSHRPVFFELDTGTVRANALTFLSAEKTLVFRGKVKVHLVKEEKEGDAKPKPEPLPWLSKAPAPASAGAAPTVSSQ